jgi:hypothetical protein
MIDIDRNLYKEFVNNLKSYKNFSFARYGDGEWALALNKEPVYSHLVKKWGESITSAGEDLKRVLLSSPKYEIGVQPLSYNQWGDDIDKFLPLGVKTSNSDIFHRSSIKENLQEFIDSLNQRKVLLVGPHYLSKLTLFPNTHVQTPEYHVWKSVDEVAERISHLVEKDLVILYSCSITANILIHHFYQIHEENITQIDTGSLWDPYVGMNSRSYHSIVIDRLGISKKDVTYPKLK